MNWIDFLTKESDDPNVELELVNCSQTSSMAHGRLFLL